MMFVENARPFLTLHVGQAGVQIGNAIWELLCLEHKILPNGTTRSERNGFYDAMFIKSSFGTFMPRSVFVDTDSSCIDEVRVGAYRELFSGSQLLSDHSDAGCNYMRGRRDFNNHLVPDAVDRFRWLMEKTDTVPTVFLIHGISGGTGSGVAASCLESLVADFGSSLRVIELNVTSGCSGLQNSCELINQVLYQFESRDFTDLTFSLTNSAMFNVCRSGLSMTNATYAHINRMVAMCFSNLTAMERFPGTVQCSVCCISNNVLPFKHLKHPILACGPFSDVDATSRERISPLGVASAVVEQDSQFADVDLRQGRHMAGVLIFRGAAKPADIEQAMATLRPKSRMEFVDWAPAGFKTGLIELPPLAVASSGIGSSALSVTMISNHTAVASLFRGQSESIRKLSSGNYFMHKYENMISGGMTAGHNSDIRTMLNDACEHMDYVATVYETGKPPDVGGEVASMAPSQRMTKQQSQQITVLTSQSATLPSPRASDWSDQPRQSDLPARQSGLTVPPSVVQLPTEALKPMRTLDGEPETLAADGSRWTLAAEPAEPKQTGSMPAERQSANLLEPNNCVIMKQSQYESGTVSKHTLVSGAHPNPADPPAPDAVPDSAKSSSRVTMGHGYASSIQSISGIAPPLQTPPPSVPMPKQKVAGGCCRKQGAPRKASPSSGCCKNRQPARVRSQSQNHSVARGLQPDTESWRSSSSSDLLAHWHRSQSSEFGKRRISNRHNHRGESTVSSRSADSSQELCDITQSCRPGSPLVDTTISSVRQIIAKYNQMFAEDSAGAAAQPRR